MAEILALPFREGSSLARVSVWLFFVAVASGCAGSGERPRDGPELSEFAEDALISGRVVENSTACVVDAVCYLRIEFADTLMVALYGTGERPAPGCEISREVSDLAFEAQPGEVISVVVSKCDSDRHYMRELVRGTF